MEEIRRGRFWLLGVQLATIAPQWDRLPGWLIALVLLACCWRLPRLELRLPPPGGALRALLFAASVAGLWYSYHSLVGPEAGTSFLIVCMAFKLLEMRTRRDCHVVLIFGFFVVATNFLFDQSLWLTLYAGLVVVLIAGSLLALHQPAGEEGGETLRHALVLVGQALPLMVILYLFFPRLPPLWTLHLGQGGGHTGLSDSMSPGDFSHLSQSDALVFRVEFQGATPPKDRLYWRALVLSDFDGDTWRQEPGLAEGGMVMWARDHNVPDWVNDIRIDRDQGVLHYRIIQEPSDQPWLYGLYVPKSDDPNIGLAREYTLVNREPVSVRTSYDVTSFDPVAVDTQLPLWLRNLNLRLPPGNPRTRALAAELHRQAGNELDYTRAVLAWLRAGHFRYSLDPPPLSGNQIDEFLFDTRQGFCEHYAAAFVVLMRAAGIPARVVAGYQGGKPGRSGGYWEVRQMDAHAWAEIWLPDRGWTEFDPTAAVAPGRIEQGASTLMDQQAYWGNAVGGELGFRAASLWRGVHEWMDDLNFRWNRDVLGYDSSRQDSFMRRLLGTSDYIKRTLVMVACFAVVLGLVLLGWWLRQPRHRDPPPDRYYRLYCRRMARAGLPRQPGEGPVNYAERVAQARPDLAESAREVGRLYSQLRYQPAGVAQSRRLGRLRRLAFTPVRTSPRLHKKPAA